MRQVALLAGKVIGRVDAALCGAASGQFWETYGPYGADPVEYEGTQPKVVYVLTFAG
jgi:hypothetical protein